MTHTPGRYSVHQKKTLLLPFLYKLAMPDNQFMFSSSSLLRPRFELRTLAGYKGRNIIKFHTGIFGAAVSWKSNSANMILSRKYRVIQNDCRGFNNLSYTIHLR